jgi:hypothetical protein
MGKRMLLFAQSDARILGLEEKDLPFGRTHEARGEGSLLKLDKPNKPV